jgi:serine/threonine-protein kinase
VSTELSLPHKFGSYVLFDKIGQGGMAELFLARNTSGKLLVVKLILPVYAERPEFATMLADEAKLAATLSHANVVQVVDLGLASWREQERLFIAMEYVEGFDLSALLKRCSKEKVPLPPEYAFHVVMELLAALDYAHKKNVVHRDVSPSNVLVSFDGEVKLCDFGIARANTAVGSEPTEAIKGKAGYMSPEHARGDVIDGRADVFAAGIILWELLAGRKLYKGGDLIEQARAAEIPELPSRDFPDEEKLHAIAKRALAPKRDDRYATAGEMRRDLAEWTMKAKLGASAIKLGDWLAEHFGKELREQRASREAAAKSLDPSPKPARALLTPTPPPSITYKDDGPALNEEASPESLSPVDISPPSQKPAQPKEKSPPWGVIIAGLFVAGVVVWLLSR